MTKNDLANRVAADLGINQSDAKQAVQLILDDIVDILTTRGRMELRNFGVFEIKTRKPRKARNPKTGETVMVPERKGIVFRPGKVLEEKIAKPTNITRMDTYAKDGEED